MPFSDPPSLIKNDKSFRKYQFKLEKETPETQREILARDIPQPDPDAFAAMPKLFQELAKASPRHAWNPERFFRGKKNVAFGESHEAARTLERAIFGHSPWSSNPSTPAWKIRAWRNFSEFVHGSPYDTNLALRYLVARKLGGGAVLPEDEVSREFLEKYTRGHNIPPIEFGDGGYSVRQPDVKVSGHYKITIPRRPELATGLSPYDIIRHELDHHKQASPRIEKRGWGPSDERLSSVEFISVADAAFMVMFHQEREIRRRMRAKGVSHPDKDPALYRRIRREVVSDPLYAQRIVFPSGFEVSLGDFAELARQAGFDISKKEITADVTTMMAKGKEFIRHMVFGSHADPADYFSRNRHEGGIIQETKTPASPVSKRTNPLILTPDAREKEMPDWRDRMASFGYKKVGNKGDDSDWKYFPELDPRSKKK